MEGSHASLNHNSRGGRVKFIARDMQHRQPESSKGNPPMPPLSGNKAWIRPKERGGWWIIPSWDPIPSRKRGVGGVGPLNSHERTYKTSAAATSRSSPLAPIGSRWHCDHPLRSPRVHRNLESCRSHTTHPWEERYIYQLICYKNLPFM